MKKSVEILGLPVISITEGRELGMSKTLLIDAKNGKVAAVTIEDDDWYRGVKLIPYDSVIAIGDDAVTVTNSENILKLDEAGDFEALLDENIRVIGTKAITKGGTIQGKISELYIGDDGKIEKCEITAPDGTASDVVADQISIFGKQVTVIDPDGEKKTEFVAKPVVKQAPPAAAAKAAPAVPEAAPAPAPEPPKKEEAEAKNEPAADEPKEVPAEAAAETSDTAEKTEAADAADTKTDVKAEADEKAADTDKAAEEKSDESEADKPGETAAAAQATDAAAADAAKATSPTAGAPTAARAADTKAADDRHRRFLLGKKAARTIKMDNGIVIVEAGAIISEEVLQKAKLANKFIELTMNVQ